MKIIKFLFKLLFTTKKPTRRNNYTEPIKYYDNYKNPEY